MWLAHRRFRRCGGEIPLDDLLSAAHLALVRSAAFYDPARGPFDAFAAVAIRRELRQEELRWKGWRSLRYFEDAPLLDEKETYEPPDRRTPLPDRQALITELLALLRHRLPERPWSFLWRYYILDETLPAIAESLGVTRQYIQQQISQALAISRWYVGDSGGELPAKPPPGQRQRKGQVFAPAVKKAAVARWLQEGLTIKEMAQRLKCSTSSVGVIALKLQRRRRRRRLRC